MLIRTISTNQILFSSNSSSDSFVLQVPCAVHVNFMALHTCRSTWGADALDFKPTRWINSSGGFYIPPRGTYMPWSSGPRTCPGQKMSQVEFVSVVMTIFRRCNVEPIPRSGQSMKQAREDLLGLAQDSTSVLALQMNRPEDIRLRWTRR
jgi:hypothetical protein